MNDMRSFINKINAIDQLNENRSLRNSRYFPPEQMVPPPDDYDKKHPSKYIDYYGMFYNYISSWLDVFDSSRNSSQKLSTEKFERNLQRLEEIFSIFKRARHYVIPYELLLKIDTIVENIKMTFSKYKTVNDPEIWDRDYRDKIVSYLEQIQNLLDASMKDKKSKRSIGYYKEDRFIRPYNFITNWLLTFSQLDQKNQYPLISTLEENYNGLLRLIRKIPGYSAWINQSGKKLFEFEHRSFTNILSHMEGLAKIIKDYSAEIRLPTNPQVTIWKEEFSNKIANLLQELQQELDFLRHKNRVIQRVARYADKLVPDFENPTRLK
jgi:hypothetical protein